MQPQTLQKNVAGAASRLVEHLADGPKTQNEIYTWWAVAGREPTELRDAIVLLVEQGRAVAKKIHGVKLLELASKESKTPAAPEPPRTWTPGVKPRQAEQAAAPAPAAVGGGLAWITTGQAAELLGVNHARVKQYGNDGRLIWRVKDGTTRNREYSRASVEKLAELRARGELPRPNRSATRAPTPPAEPAAAPRAPEPPPPPYAIAVDPPVPITPVALRRFALAISDQLVDYLEQLRRIGLYGDTVEAVAERLICEALLRRVEAPKLKLRGAA